VVDWKGIGVSPGIAVGKTLLKIMPLYILHMIS